MTIDEITVALEEWKGDNKDRHLLLLAVDDEGLTATVLGNGLYIGGALASVMREEKKLEDAVRLAMILNAEDNDEAGTE